MCRTSYEYLKLSGHKDSDYGQTLINDDFPSSSKMLLTHSTHKVFTNSVFAVDSSEVRLSFFIKVGSSKAS